MEPLIFRKESIFSFLAQPLQLWVAEAHLGIGTYRREAEVAEI